MKYVSLRLVAAGLMICGTSTGAEYEVHLRGLFNLAEWQGALLEVKHSLARSNEPPVFFPSMTRLVKPGEKFEDATIKGGHINFEVLEINIEGERVKLRENGKVSVYGFEKIVAAALSTNLGFELQGAGFADTVDLYSQLKDRTVLIHPKIIGSPVSVRSAARNEVETTVALEKAFRDRGISTVADGNKFVLIFPTAIEEAITPRSKKTGLASPQFGSVYLNSPLSSVIENYARILERERLGDDPVPRSPVYLRTRILSKAEIQYAYDTLLEWNGLKIVVIDDMHFKVVRVPEVNAR